MCTSRALLLMTVMVNCVHTFSLVHVRLPNNTGETSLVKAQGDVEDHHPKKSTNSAESALPRQHVSLVGKNSELEETSNMIQEVQTEADSDFELEEEGASDFELEEEDDEKPKQAGKSADDIVAWNDIGYPEFTTSPILSSDNGEDYVGWSLCGVPVHSNLAGVGPDVGEMSIRYYGVATAGGGQSVDLVITANSSYHARDINVNGLVSDDSCFGVINLKSKPREGYNSVDLLFSYYLTGTNTSVALEKNYLTVYDYDSSADATEHVTYYKRVKQMFYLPDHEMAISGHITGPIGLTFSSTQQGNGQDNPKDPMSLTMQQQRRAVMVTYENQEQWKMTFAVSGGKSGRNFAFAGLSNLLKKQTTTTTTTLPAKTTTTLTNGGSDQTPAPTCDQQSCEVWADPHVSGFDNSENQGPGYLALLGGGAHRGASKSVIRGDTARSGMHTFDGRPVDVGSYDSGDFWLVKSEPVHIQARFRRSGEFIPDRAAVGAVAVGGPFLRGHKLIVEPLDGKVTFDGQPLVPRGTWRNRGGDVSVRQDGAFVYADFPMGVQTTFKRLDKHIDVKISMPPIPGGVDGECGNFDGIAENDEERDINDRMGDVRIHDSQLLLARDTSGMSMNSTGFTEADYQVVAGFRDDSIMARFVKKVLAATNQYVLPEDEGALQGFVQWYSGTRSTQSFQKLLDELSSKSWVQDVKAPDAASATVAPALLAISPTGARKNSTPSGSSYSKARGAVSARPIAGLIEVTSSAAAGNSTPLEHNRSVGKVRSKPDLHQWIP